MAAAMAATALLAIAGTIDVWTWQHRAAGSPGTAIHVDPSSVVVLPIVDLTDSMGEGIFADGMTEELIDKLSHIPGLRVPSPTASFWFKDKRMTVSEIAAKLGVAYVLDGSVRQSDTTMRVAARLVRADDGFVIWSRSYDRPLDDRLMIQDDIAGEVRKALEATIRRGVAPSGSVEKSG
jgi:TolB-like protein